MNRRHRLIPLLLAPCIVAGLFPAESAESAKRCYLWKTTSASATVYLLGSLHVGRADLYPLDRAITEAFNASDALVLEVRLTPETEQQAALLGLQLGVYQDGRTLKDTLSADTMALLEAHLQKNGLSLAQVANLKPWFLGLTLAMREYVARGYLPQFGIDTHFSKLAAGKKEILELETIEQQMKLLASCEDAVADLSLREGLKQLPEADRFMRQITDAWRTGDAEAVDVLMQEALIDDPRLKTFHSALLDDRNTAMAAEIEKLLATNKTYFVVVGSAHLAGKAGIVQLLLDKKHGVEQIRQKGRPQQ